MLHADSRGNMSQRPPVCLWSRGRAESNGNGLSPASGPPERRPHSQAARGAASTTGISSHDNCASTERGPRPVTPATPAHCLKGRPRNFPGRRRLTGRLRGKEGTRRLRKIALSAQGARARAPHAPPSQRPRQPRNFPEVMNYPRPLCKRQLRFKPGRLPPVCAFRGEKIYIWQLSKMSGLAAGELTERGIEKSAHTWETVLTPQDV